MATLAVARSRRLVRPGPGPGPAVTVTALAGIAGCIMSTSWYLAEHPTYHRSHPATTLASLPPVTAAALAAMLAGGLWRALRPPRWLVASRHGRRLGVAMAVVLAAGFVLVSRLGQRGVAGLDAGMMSYLLFVPLGVGLAGSAAAAAVGRSFRAGLAACAWATALGALLVIAAWLAEAPRWYQQGRGLLLDGEGGIGVGVNLGDAVWWTLLTLVLWMLPVGVIGAAAGSAGARRRRGQRRATNTYSWLSSANGSPAKPP